MVFVLDIMQVTFVTKPIAGLPTAGFNSQGMGTQAKTLQVEAIKSFCSCGLVLAHYAQSSYMQTCQSLVLW